MNALQLRDANIEIKFGNDAAGCQRYCLGRNSFRKLAEEADAVVYFGRSRRNDFEKIDEYLRTQK